MGERAEAGGRASSGPGVLWPAGRRELVRESHVGTISRRSPPKLVWCIGPELALASIPADGDDGSIVTRRSPLLLFSMVVAWQPHQELAQANSEASRTVAQRPAVERDGQHDFDFEFGSWKAHLSRLSKPLTGSTTWVEYDGTSVVRKVWDGRANLGELEVDGPAGHIEGLTLRLYNPKSRQWSITFSNSNDGTPGQAMLGQFKNGRGEFYDQEFLDGRAIYVRFVFSEIAKSSFKFEQAFSDDGGKTWEVNWVAKFIRT
jgi:hypothetical protein